ncbi:hypothetical protein [Paraburkholderia hayleyella]|uniref:hypothetical protein n=1 Tax=Paraburkholderia hayleyella TaxID=2152889 RepID=UPI001C65F1E3|nr:hypothetical protein [Paraburkholderia hayleyella]
MLTASQYLLNDPLHLDSVRRDSLVWLAGILLTGAILGVLTPGYSRACLLGLMLVWLIAGVGLTQALVVAVWLLSAWSIGAILLRWLYSGPANPNPAVSSTVAILLGTTIWLGIWGVMLHFPANYPSLYLGLCLLPLLALPSLRPLIFTNLRGRTLALHHWMQSIPFWAWVAGLALIAWTLRWASLPNLVYDDQALHLRLWTELLYEQRALFDVRNQIWAVAPFTTDLLHAGLSLIAGATARSAMNLTLALVLLTLFVRILQRLNIPAWVQWLLLVLMASTPMLGYLLLSLQTELMLAVLGLAGLYLVLESKGDWRSQAMPGLLACAALCAAIKLPGAILGVALLASFAWHCCCSRRAAAAPPPAPLRWSALVLLIPLTFVALHAYLIAWQMTGNPVFPLYNAVFRSPLLPPDNLSDSRWIHGFSLNSYIRAFFQTSDFLESGNYVAGWQYLLLLPFALIAVWRKGVPAGLRLALLPLFGFGLAMFATTQYWRYLFPVMPIAGIVLAALFIRTSRGWQTIVIAVTLTCIGLNLVFFKRISSLMSLPAQAAYTKAGKMQFEHLHAPPAILTAEVNRIAPGSRVLYPPRDPFGATLHGTPLYVNGYAPFRRARFDALKNSQDMASFLADEKVDFAILRLDGKLDPEVPQVLLREYLAQYGIALAQEGMYILYRLNRTPVSYQPVFDLHSAMLKHPGQPTLQLPLPASGTEITATQQP